MHTQSARKTPGFIHSIRTKTMAALTLGVLGLVATLYAAGQFYLLKSFEGLEAREGRATMERVRQAIQEQEAFLLTKAQDWAYWDDAYKFVQDGNDAFKESNLTDNAVGNLKIHILVYLNDKNEVMSYLQGDVESYAPTAKTEGASLFLGPDSPYLKWSEDKLDDGHSGIVLLPEGPALIVSKPVITSEQKGPIKGTMIFGQYIDKSLLTRLSELTNLKLSLDLVGDPAASAVYTMIDEKNPIQLEVKDESLLQGYTLFKDVFGQPAIGLTSPIPRELMGEGRNTIALFTRIVGGLGLLFVLLMGFVIDRTMVARLLGLSKQVSNIEPTDLASGDGAAVVVPGKDEVATLSGEINEMLAIIGKHARAMGDIVDNVSFGFLICDLSGTVKPGLTKSCSTLLDQKLEAIPGQKITTALGMSSKEAAWFMTLYNQLCEDIFPEDTSLSQMPARFMISGTKKVVRLEGRVLREKMGGVPRGVLFSLTDITDLERAELENREAKTLLKILQAPIAFRDFIQEMKAQTNSLPLAIADGDQKLVRRVLHTLKGNFGCFGLESIAQEIHHIEDNSEISVLDVKRVEALIREFLAKNKSILAMDFDHLAHVDHSLTEESLQRLEQIAHASSEVQNLMRHDFRSIVADIRQKPASELLGPLSDMVEQIAFKLGKSIHFVMEGAAERVDPSKFKAVADILPHMIRNSIDHGIEDSEERLDLNKPLVGMVHLSVKKIDVAANHPLGEGVMVTLRDDGRGIRTDRVVQKAIEMGLVTAAEVEAMSESDKSSLIFKDALSTADQVSEISGRGFGMSAVKESILKVGGRVSIENKAGEGCKFMLFIPSVEIASQGVESRKAA